jgi:hypothetical protein
LLTTTTPRLFYVKANKKVGASEKRLIQEDFSTLLLNVKDDISLEELMDDYFCAGDPEPASPTTITADASAGSKNENDTKAAQMSDITVTELPPVLQIHLIRTRFDRSDKTSYKSNATVALPKRIYLDQYLESNQEEHGTRFKRMKLWKRERRICRKMLDVVKSQAANEALRQDSHSLGDNAGSCNLPSSDTTDQPTPSCDASKDVPGFEEIGMRQRKN